MEHPMREARCRVVIEHVDPEVDAGRFPIKRTAGERVVVEADVFAEGHDELACVLLHRRAGETEWQEAPMRPLVNDRWRGEFNVGEPGGHVYTLEGWVDHFHTWVRDLVRRMEAGQDVTVELQIGAVLVTGAAGRAAGADAARLREHAAALTGPTGGHRALSLELAELMARYPDRCFATRYERELQVLVDRERARFGAWYEMFPRSAARVRGRHGTFKDVEARLPYVAGMGFDVLYLPPIHPIGRTHRKGRNNSVKCEKGDVGSPWAIGGPEGGHKSIHPDLGTLEDFRHLVVAAKRHGLEIAMDVAFQASPDHPYVREHPEWFKHRPDGSIQYAENPPKKYEDIYPFDFETENWRELWQELLSIVLFWAGHGVRIFRVDNPHTKPFAFWEWLIAEVRRAHPEVIFLSEAFTRPKVMYRLAKVGLSQSYTYFAWRNTAYELYQYFSELSQQAIREFFRPNLWPNTPDILTEYLQTGGRPAFQARLILAATLGASYGIYGPPLEALEGRARESGSEEYLDSEKYQLRDWKPDDGMHELITIVNRIRRDNPALQTDRGLRFHLAENEQLLAYSKSTPDNSNVVLTVVNVDPHHVQRGMVNLPLDELGIDSERPYQAHELISGARYFWSGPRNYVEINPLAMPAQVFRFRRRVRSEHDFEYFL